jgi:hypothetical protein
MLPKSFCDQIILDGFEAGDTNNIFPVSLKKVLTGLHQTFFGVLFGVLY